MAWDAEQVERKARGAFFTPPALADFLVEWAVRSGDDRILEPSCGEAAFLISAADRLRDLGILTPSIDGVELHEDSARAARRLAADLGIAAEIRTSDFFDVEATRRYNAVIGNPPYVRYQGFTGDARAKSQQAALAEGVRLPGLASSWAAFVVHASAFLRPHGRLALVLPAELLSVNYAAPVRRFLLDRFAKVRLVMFEERVFPGVLEEVVLLLAEGTGPTDHFEVCQVRNAEELDSVEPRRFAPLPAEGKWTAALIGSDAVDAYLTLANDGQFVPLIEWGDPDLGIVTGNNRYFTLTLEDVRRTKLRRSDLLPISPPGSRHLRGLSFTTKAWEELAANGARAYLFYPSEPLNNASATYIGEGERDRVHEAYKCRVRSPWWRVPLVPKPDLFLTYMNHDAPRLVSNRADMLPLNSVHGFRFKPGLRTIGMDLLPIGFLNSVTLLGSELVGRSYGGGILKLEPKEADLVPVPSPDLLRACARDLRALRPQLSRLLRGGDLDEAAKLVDRVLLREGLNLRHAQLAPLRQARHEMFRRRVARAEA